jgi:uncharacterized membrane protein
MYKLLLTAIVFVIIDGIFLSMMKPYFENQVKLVQGSALKANITATLLCYVFLIFGIYYFIIQPNKSVQDAFLFGIVIYAVYETTSRALLTKWKWTTVFIDTLWGGILFALTAWIMKKMVKLLGLK